MGEYEFLMTFRSILTILDTHRQVMLSGLPKSEQANAMVSSIWISSQCLGCFIGSTLGSYSFDVLGFETGTMILAFCMFGAVLFIAMYTIRLRLEINDGREYQQLLETMEEKNDS